MLAVVKIAGQQFKVQAGDSLYVPHLQGKTGDKVEFNDVLFVDNNGSISFATKAVVKAEITNDLVQGDKVIAFKMKRSCLLYTSPSPRDVEESRMPSSA